MQKIIGIILLLPYITGCATLKKSTITKTAGIERNKVNYQEIRGLNLSNNDFNVIKAEIIIASSEGKERLLGNIKYQDKGTFLISLRNRSGIEGARVFITNDTIIVNDRINEKLYYGSAGYLENKYGVKTSILPVIIGDFILDDSKKEIMECIKNRTYVNEIVEGKEIFYTIDCRIQKVINVVLKDRYTGKKINIELRNFIETEEYTVARNIYITNDNKEERIDINIEKLNIGLEREITFIPGRNYEKILLR